jgi:hypothetical protein
LALLPQTFNQMFWSRQQAGYFATDFGKLVDSLEKIEPEYASQQDLLNKVRASNSKNNKMKSITDKIPRKPPAAPSGETSYKKQRKLCQKCSKWSPETKDSHNTKMCRKWNDDGTRKSYGKQSARNVNMHGKSDTADAMLSCFMQMQKDQQKLIQKLSAKSKRKRGKKSRGYSSGDSSDSD